MSREDILTALSRAREKAQLARAIARQLSVREARDTVMLEAIALEAVIGRIERHLADAGGEDLSELVSDIDRLTSILGGERVDLDNPPLPRLH